LGVGAATAADAQAARSNAIIERRMEIPLKEESTVATAVAIGNR
jgi:hypothetical protein